MPRALDGHDWPIDVLPPQQRKLVIKEVIAHAIKLCGIQAVFLIRPATRTEWALPVEVYIVHVIVRRSAPVDLTLLVSVPTSSYAVTCKLNHARQQGSL